MYDDDSQPVDVFFSTGRIPAGTKRCYWRFRFKTRPYCKGKACLSVDGCLAYLIGLSTLLFSPALMEFPIAFMPDFLYISMC